MTSEATAYVKIFINLFWTDPRLKDWPSSKPLPQGLWRPVPVCQNRTSDSDEFHGDPVRLPESLDVEQHGEGISLRTYTMLSGHINNKMDLHNFPLDEDDLEIVLSFDSPSRTFVRDERKQVLIEWDGDIIEWTLLGSSVKHWTFVTGYGLEKSHVTLRFWVQRQSGYYFWKVKNRNLNFDIQNSQTQN